jgi:DUF4097 and DUF4098 domain-containing protein YvlB
MKYQLFFLLLGIFSFGQETIKIQENDNFTVELPESLNKVLESKEKQEPPKPPKVEPEYCKGASIQIFYSKNRQEAEKKVKDFNAKFPPMNSKLIFVSPEYKVKVGTYKTREDASADLNKIRKEFPLSLISDEKFRCSLLK